VQRHCEMSTTIGIFAIKYPKPDEVPHFLCQAEQLWL